MCAVRAGSTWQRRACAGEACWAPGGGCRRPEAQHRGPALHRDTRGSRPLGVSFNSVRRKWSAKTMYVFVCNPCAAVSMKADGFQVPAGVKKALAPAVAALSIAAPAFAEGTGEVRRGLHGPCERCACLSLAKWTPQRVRKLPPTKLVARRRCCSWQV